MIHLVVAALIQVQSVPRPPLRDVRDPGVVATGQRISPVGVQSVFTGRVSGVRFGRTPDEIWVATPSTTYRLDWRANQATARIRVDGTPGVHGVTIDPVTRRALVSSVGRLPATSSTPGAAPARQPAVAYLSGLSGEAAGDSLSPV